MTTEEKMQQLFKAALHAPEPTPAGLLKRAAPPAPSRPAAPQAAPQAAAEPMLAVTSVAADATPEPLPATVSPAQDAGLDDETSAELGRMLDERHIRSVRKDRRNRLAAVAALLLAAGGSTYWVASNPERVATLKQAVVDIKTVSDKDAMLSSYQESLDKIATRGNDIEEATLALGAVPEPEATPPAQPAAPAAATEPRVIIRHASSDAPVLVETR